MAHTPEADFVDKADAWDMLAVKSAEIVKLREALKNTTDALTYLLGCMDDADPFKRKVQVTRDAGRNALARDGGTK
jgi:hypothetical protein